MKIALLQITSGDDPAENLETVLGMMRDAASQGAEFALTPEVTNCLTWKRAQQDAVLQLEDDDDTLAALRAEAKALGVWLSIGSLALKTGDADGRFANRSFMIAPDGSIAGRYDKIHMFDVTVSEAETYRESKGYRPGDHATLVKTPFGGVGMSVCYDVRFAYLYRQLAQAGADILLVPAAFSPVTGAAHWETLLRARAIETGCYVFAAAQTGTYDETAARPRTTYGHSLVVSPWGEVLADGGTDPTLVMVDIDVAEVSHARKRIPALTHDRDFAGP
ncbi:putative amidohydrolase [Loktanella ponticola]|uniref:Putative amidohydrolase n=1 Tax=Yoonia ponticola TaxID=1524255 RepID=A0A7W9BIT6_9RHOB|nr:carbon-nitrogen hydrolase family protein [Yoonia ponticola]MBB5721348.1 putative amidohydrolase [Yoonia ponticola]